MISAASTSLAEACVRRRAMFPTYPDLEGPHGPGHRRLQRHRPAASPRRCCTRACAFPRNIGRKCRRRGHFPGGRPTSEPSGAASRPCAPAQEKLGNIDLLVHSAGIYNAGPIASISAAALEEMFRDQRLLRVLPACGAAPARPAQRRVHRQHRPAARRAGAFALRGLQRRGAVDDDVHSRWSWVPG